MEYNQSVELTMEDRKGPPSQTPIYLWILAVAQVVPSGPSPCAIWALGVCGSGGSLVLARGPFGPPVSRAGLGGACQACVTNS